KYFNGSCNVINVSPENFDENQKLDLTNLPLDNDAPLPINQFINEITTDINSLYKENVVDKKLAYIIDCSDILINQSNNEFSNSNIANLLSVITNNYNSSFLDYIHNNIKIILISRNQESINNLFTNKNIELKFVNILKPNFSEKEKFIKDMKDAFELENKLDSENNKQIQEAVSLASDLNFRQILQLIKLSKNIDDIKDFRSLYNMYTFDKKESEWEKINKEKIKTINQSLSERVKGQSYAIDQVKKTIIRSFVGLTGAAQSSNSKKPKGILFFAGPTGVGKTELAKALTEFVFGDESKFIRFDMSEYNHEHSDQKLIGSPPGYVGYETGGQLTNAVKNNPFSILLFDEIEKAHGKILDKFLQILEDGRLTSSKGELIDFSETFIIFTSNLGTEKALEKINSPEEEIRKTYFDAIKFHFYQTLKRPEIYNRIGEKNIVPFNFVTNISIIEEILN
ncbi:MAG: AAA family ATPase, partial [Malacoplasma sp.]|nr:AAA family ATPase [Malacoplasma sp.]